MYIFYNHLISNRSEKRKDRLEIQSSPSTYLRTSYLCRASEAFGSALSFTWQFISSRKSLLFSWEDNLHWMERGRLKATLTRFTPLLTTDLPMVDIGDGILNLKILHTVNISSATYLPYTYLSTYLVHTTSCQRSLWMPPKRLCRDCILCTEYLTYLHLVM